LPEAEITATDISLQALNIARENARLHGVGVNFLQGDLYGAHDPESAAYDLVVSNPPYIPSGEIERLGPEIRHEPRIALDGGSDGLEFYRRIISGAGAFLKDGGFLILEMGFSQAGPIKDIFLRSGSFQIIDVVKDYSGIERVIVAKKLCPPTFIRKWSLLR
jgi:release factor glutamine methyltransferase